MLKSRVAKGLREGCLSVCVCVLPGDDLALHCPLEGRAQGLGQRSAPFLPAPPLRRRIPDLADLLQNVQVRDKHTTSLRDKPSSI